MDYVWSLLAHDDIKPAIDICSVRFIHNIHRIFSMDLLLSLNKLHFSLAECMMKYFRQYIYVNLRRDSQLAQSSGRTGTFPSPAPIFTFIPFYVVTA